MEITYGELFKRFAERNPDLAKAIVDYRPSSGVVGIEIFFENRRSMVFSYDFEKDEFNFVN